MPSLPHVPRLIFGVYLDDLAALVESAGRTHAMAERQLFAVGTGREHRSGPAIVIGPTHIATGGGLALLRYGHGGWVSPLGVGSVKGLGRR